MNNFKNLFGWTVNILLVVLLLSLAGCGNLKVVREVIKATPKNWTVEKHSISSFYLKSTASDKNLRRIFKDIAQDGDKPQKIEENGNTSTVFFPENNTKTTLAINGSAQNREITLKTSGLPGLDLAKAANDVIRDQNQIVFETLTNEVVKRGDTLEKVSESNEPFQADSKAK